MKRFVKEYFIVILLVFLLIFSLQFMIWPKEDEYVDQLKGQRFKGHQVLLLSSAKDAFNARRDFISQAKSSIYISSYKLHDDKFTKILLNDLYKAADRGVMVNVLVDYRFGGLKDRGFINHPNIKFYAYNPLKIRNLRGFQSVHHEKFLVVDGEYTILGGRNIGERFFGDDAVNDLDVLVFGSDIASEGIRHFQKHINFSSQIKEIKGKGSYNLDGEGEYRPTPIDHYLHASIEVEEISFLTNDIDTKKRKGYLFSVFKSLALSSDEKYWVSPYSTKSKYLLELFDDKTVFQTNSIASSPNYPAFSNYYRNKNHYLDTGAIIYEYQDFLTSIHTKAYLFDDFLYVGSMNLDHRSFNINTEAMLLIKSDALRKDFLEIMAEYEELSVAYVGDEVIHAEREKRASLFKVILMRIASLFSRLLAPFV